jgi:cytochrome c-type biogenesis protein CcmH/NrfF
MRSLLVAMLLALLGASPALAAEPRASLPDVEDEVMCVTCNVPLFIAESPQASRQRAYIRRLIDDGLTKDQIKQRLVVEYGEDVLALPEEEGVGLAAYVVPIATFVLLAAILVLLLPRWRRRAPRRGPALAGAGAPVATDAELQRLDEDLRTAPDPMGGVDTTIFAAFAAGFVSFISPCVLPLVPGYLSAVSGVSIVDLQEGQRKPIDVLLPRSSSACRSPRSSWRSAWSPPAWARPCATTATCSTRSPAR